MNNQIVPGFDDVKNDSVSIKLQVIDSIPKCLALYGTGYIDTYNAGFFEGRVALVAKAGYKWLVFDMHGISYVSSYGHGALVSIQKAVKGREGGLVLARMQPKVYEVSQLLGLASFFSLADSVPEAVEMLSGSVGRAAESPFPRVAPCPFCQRRLLARKAGVFRCPECKTVLTFDESGRAGLRHAAAPAVMRHSS